MSQVQNAPTVLQASISKTSTFDGTGVDISAMTAEPGMITVRVKITSLTANKTVVFALEDSVDAFNSDVRTLATLHVKGPFSSINPREKDFHTWEMPAVRFGVGSATMRLSLISIDSAATVVYQAHIQG